ncbi:MAG: tetratricopeptide repeat protein [Aulosira sp. DedQUE10]|nr:tetratricopeptide repeat protein [Aulosira sp. DedQUE10]
MKTLKLAVAILALGTLAISPKAEAKSLFKTQQTTPSKITAQVPRPQTENSSKAEAYLKQGLQRFESKDYQGAIEQFNQVLNIEPNNIYAYVSRGTAKMLLEQFQSAKTDFDTALKITPDIAYAHYFRGFTNYALKDKPAAIADLRKASVLFQKDGNADLAQKADNAAKEIEAS